jgi:hypothetical protein
MMNIFQKIKAFFAVKKVVEDEIKELKTMDIKSGWRSSEFWSKLAAQAVVIWGAVGGFVPPKYAAIIVVAAEGIYTIARSVLKMVEVIQAAKATQTTVTTTAPTTTVTTPS